MKDTIHYQIGQQIGDFTISSYDQNEGCYILTCKCGKTSKGASDHVTKKISRLLAEGYVACQSCTFNYKKKLEEERASNDVMYSFKDVYREYVNKAKKRGINFELPLEECFKLFDRPCYYCGDAPNNCRVRHNGYKVYYQGLDRLNNNKGYIENNVVPCCKYCNSFKMDRTEQEFMEHVSRVFKKVQRLSPQGEYTQASGNGKHPTYEGEDIV